MPIAPEQLIPTLIATVAHIPIATVQLVPIQVADASITYMYVSISTPFTCSPPVSSSAGTGISPKPVPPLHVTPM